MTYFDDDESPALALWKERLGSDDLAGGPCWFESALDTRAELIRHLGA